MPLPSIKLSQGIHILHLFFRVDRVRWAALPAGESAATRERLFEIGMEPENGSSARFAEYVKNEIAKWARVIKTTGLKPD